MLALSSYMGVRPPRQIYIRFPTPLLMRRSCVKVGELFKGEKEEEEEEEEKEEGIRRGKGGGNK